jgi:alanine racemase
MPTLPRLAWLEIDTAALADNLRTIQELVGRDVGLAAVVKSDGYGHGLEIAARTFASAGAAMLCVATLDEALTLRRAGVQGRILVLYDIPVERLGDAVAAGLELVAGEGRWLEKVLAAWPQGGVGGRRELRLHLEIETGLGRAGVPPEAAAPLAELIEGTAGAQLAGLWSHLASSDDPGASGAQVGRFDAAEEGMRAAGIALPPRHLAGSGGIFAASASGYELVRPGIALYGELTERFPVAEAARGAAGRLRPAMTLKARPLRIERFPAGTGIGYGALWRAPRESVVATLPVGYGDGYSRAYGAGSGAEGHAEVLVRGRRAPVVGSVAMDAIAVDVTAIPDLVEADEFVLLGAQGDDRITAGELARLRTTIPYEVLTGMSARLPRVYHSPAGLLGLRTLEGETVPPARGAAP